MILRNGNDRFRDTAGEVAMFGRDLEEANSTKIPTYSAPRTQQLSLRWRVVSLRKPQDKDLDKRLQIEGVVL